MQSTPVSTIILKLKPPSGDSRATYTYKLKFQSYVGMPVNPAPPKLKVKFLYPTTSKAISSWMLISPSALKRYRSFLSDLLNDGKIKRSGHTALSGRHHNSNWYDRITFILETLRIGKNAGDTVSASSRFLNSTYDRDEPRPWLSTADEHLSDHAKGQFPTLPGSPELYSSRLYALSQPTAIFAQKTRGRITQTLLLKESILASINPPGKELLKAWTSNPTEATLEALAEGFHISVNYRLDKLEYHDRNDWKTLPELVLENSPELLKALATYGRRIGLTPDTYDLYSQYEIPSVLYFMEELLQRPYSLNGSGGHHAFINTFTRWLER